jgi:hypothetical protein
MALAPLASITDLAGWLGTTPQGDDATRAELVLSAVSALVRSEARRTWEDLPVPEVIRAVTLTVAARVYRNPEAAASYSLTTGPFGKSLTFADPKAVGLFLTDDEKLTISRSVPGGRRQRGLYTLRTYRDDPCATGYVPTVGGPPFPWYGEDMP